MSAHDSEAFRRYAQSAALADTLRKAATERTPRGLPGHTRQTYAFDRRDRGLVWRVLAAVSSGAAIWFGIGFAASWLFGRLIG